jgi:hypothetical protein
MDTPFIYFIYYRFFYKYSFILFVKHFFNLVSFFYDYKIFEPGKLNGIISNFIEFIEFIVFRGILCISILKYGIIF